MSIISHDTASTGMLTPSTSAGSDDATGACASAQDRESQSTGVQTSALESPPLPQSEAGLTGLGRTICMYACQLLSSYPDSSGDASHLPMEEVIADIQHRGAWLRKLISCAEEGAQSLIGQATETQMKATKEEEDARRARIKQAVDGFESRPWVREEIESMKRQGMDHCPWVRSDPDGSVSSPGEVIGLSYRKSLNAPVSQLGTMPSMVWRAISSGRLPALSEPEPEPASAPGALSKDNRQSKRLAARKKLARGASSAKSTAFDTAPAGSTVSEIDWNGMFAGLAGNLSKTRKLAMDFSDEPLGTDMSKQILTDLRASQEEYTNLPKRIANILVMSKINPRLMELGRKPINYDNQELVQNFIKSEEETATRTLFRKYPKLKAEATYWFDRGFSFGIVSRPSTMADNTNDLFVIEGFKYEPKDVGSMMNAPPMFSTLSAVLPSDQTFADLSINGSGQAV